MLKSKTNKEQFQKYYQPPSSQGHTTFYVYVEAKMQIVNKRFFMKEDESAFLIYLLNSLKAHGLYLFPLPIPVPPPPPQEKHIQKIKDPSDLRLLLFVQCTY